MGRAGSLPLSLLTHNKMNYTNSQILAAVLNQWLQPVIQQLAGQRLSSIPLLNGIENKIRSTGWVRPNWSLAAELAPFIQEISGTLLEPFINSYLSKIPDEAIPSMAHSIVDKAIAGGEMSLFDGNIHFDKSDLEELKRLLTYNLPMKEAERYVVKKDPQ